MSSAPATYWVNIMESRFPRRHLLIQWVGVWNGRIGPVVIIPYKIVTANNLKPRTKTSAEYRVFVVNACINASLGNSGT